MAHHDGPQVDKFEPFHHLKAITYTTLRDHPIPLDILIPRSVSSSSGPRPVFVNVHGGALIAGSRDFQPFWGNYILEEAQRHNAILVAPDYPLAPESQTPEMFKAINEFMNWLLSGKLQQEIDARVPELKVQTDVKKLAVVGESAGGWYALHLGLSYPDAIRALILRFPMVDLESDWFKKYQGTTKMIGMPLLPTKFLDEKLKNLRARGKVTSSSGPDRFPVGLAAIGWGRLVETVGDFEETYPLRRIKAGARLPKRTWVFHGKDDSAVPVSGSDHTVALIKKHIPDAEIHYDTRPGDHGFDTDWKIAQEPIIGERLEWLEQAWFA